MSLLFVLPATALTVDIGSAAWKKRDLQKMVDVVSLDAVRAVGDRRDPMLDHYVQALDIAQKSATRNGFDYTDTASGNSMTVELGIADAATKAFTPATAAQYGSANAVRITATHTSNNRFMPGNVPLTTQAVAMVDQIATFSLGSRLARLDTTSSPIFNNVLGQMLGSTLSLDAVSYNGLADASVTLGDVWTELGLGSSSQILNSEVTVDQLITATASALNNQGDPASVTAAGILGTLATQVSTTAHFKFGDLLELVSGDPGEAASANMNVLEMIGMAASLANGTNLLNLTLPITIPGVTTTNLKMSVIEPPVIKTGRVGATAHTAQARLQLDITLLQKLTVLLSQGTVKLPVYLDAAGATGTLTAIRCDIPDEDGDISVHAVAEALTAKIGSATDASLQDPSIPAVVNPAELVNMAGLVRVTGTATATMPASVADLVIPWHDVRSVGSSSSVTLDNNLLANLALTVQVLGLGINANTVANNLLAIINPVLNALDTTLFAPLKEALAFLGIEVGGADVANLNEDCANRRLIG
ncbi:MAG: hypothetical protein ACRDKG_08870 [Actinomycetota bacterium]